jgi:hypothetical protein
VIKNLLVKMLLLIGLSGLPLIVCGQSEEDVGDLASFGKEVKFFGYAMSGTVLVSRDCSGWTPLLGPDDRCFTINAATNLVSFDARSIGRISYPQKTFQNVIYLLPRHQYSYYFLNAASQSKGGRFQYLPYITLESNALNDPSLINPQTGQPFNGKVDIGISGSKFFNKTILPNYQESDGASYSAASVSGLTKKYFMTNFALSAQTVDNLFYEKMIIHLNIRGTTTNVEEASFNFGIRFTGN